jgi:hypothetical protein
MDGEISSLEVLCCAFPENGTAAFLQCGLLMGFARGCAFLSLPSPDGLPVLTLVL